MYDGCNPGLSKATAGWAARGLQFFLLSCYCIPSFSYSTLVQTCVITFYSFVACRVTERCDPCRSSPVIDMVPTFTTSNERICLLMTNGSMGSLRIEDAERLQVCSQSWTARRHAHSHIQLVCRFIALLLDCMQGRALSAAAGACKQVLPALHMAHSPLAAYYWHFEHKP